MGEELRVALNGEAYRKTAAFLGAGGIDTEIFMIDNWGGGDLLQGPSASDYYIEKDPAVGLVNMQQVWIDPEGRYHRIFKLEDLPPMARAALGVGYEQALPSYNAIFMAGAGMYSCFADPACDLEKKRDEVFALVFDVGEKMLSKAKKLLQLSKEEDSVPFFGYTSKWVEKAYDERIKKVEEARRSAIESGKTIYSSLVYIERSTYLFAKMLESDSGLELISMRGKEIGCVYSDWTASTNVHGLTGFIPTKITCQDPSIQIERERW